LVIAPHRFGRERDTRRREFSKQRRVRIWTRKLALDGVLHARVAHEISAFTGEESQQRGLVILICLDTKLPAMMPVRHDVLVEFGHFKRSIHVLRILGANSLHESAEHAVQVVHAIKLWALRALEKR
jgi:hypothetical protein